MQLVALLAPMRIELRPLVRALSLRREPSAAGARYRGTLGGVEVVATLAGVGTRAAAHATERLLASTRVDRVVVVGIAGGLGLSAIGDLVVPERVVDLGSGASHRPSPLAGTAPRGVLGTSDRLVVERDELARLAGQGFVAVDMETAAVAAVCEARGCPWSVIRSISDLAGDAAVDPAVAALVGPAGEVERLALVRFLLSRPWRVPGLVRVARSARLATRVATAVTARALELL